MNNIEIFEHIAVKSNLSLIEFVEKINNHISLTKIEYDFENETEWYRAYDENFIEVNLREGTYLKQDIIDSIKDEVKRRCESEDNFFGIGGYYHIKAVVKNAINLAKNYGADIEVVTIGAWLHDIASVTDYNFYEQHHIHGARIAGDILSDFNYPKEKIELVQRCILNHRGSKLLEKSSKEEICVADADAVSHFDNLPSLFHLAYTVRNYSVGEGINFVKNKLIRSYNKLSDESKEVYREKYDTVMKILD